MFDLLISLLIPTSTASGSPCGRTATTTYLHGDHLGSASLATDASGAKITDSDIRYSPYGVTRPGLAGTALPTDRRFTGQREETSLGFYDYHARYYDPALGRFISADTLVPDPGNPQSLNRYAYTLNNPLRYTDPTGHRECGEFCDDSEMNPLVPVVDPYAALQPETNLGLGEIVDFIVEPFITPAFPRIQIKAWDTSHYYVRMVSWGGDVEFEWGQSFNGRWGSKGPWLIKAGTMRLETPKGEWIEVGPMGIAGSKSPMRLPGKTEIHNELRFISGFQVSPGVLQTALTVEYTAIASIPGVQTRGTTYLRVATNTYVRRYVASAVDAAVIATGLYQLYNYVETPLPGTVPLPVRN